MPGSAVLVFDIELLELVAGLPEGYMFIWNGEVSPNLFEEIDKDGNGEVLLEEVNGPCRSCSGAFSGQESIQCAQDRTGYADLL